MVEFVSDDIFSSLLQKSSSSLSYAERKSTIEADRPTPCLELASPVKEALFIPFLLIVIRELSGSQDHTQITYYIVGPVFYS